MTPQNEEELMVLSAIQNGGRARASRKHTVGHGEAGGAKKMRTRLVALLSGTGLAVAGLIGIDSVSVVAPAEAASCLVSDVRHWSAYNRTCPRARHFNVLRNGEYKYANWATPGNVSDQQRCWVNMVRYGFEIKWR